VVGYWLVMLWFSFPFVCCSIVVVVDLLRCCWLIVDFVGCYVVDFTHSVGLLWVTIVVLVTLVVTLPRCWIHRCHSWLLVYTFTFVVGLRFPFSCSLRFTLCVCVAFPVLLDLRSLLRFAGYGSSVV